MDSDDVKKIRIRNIILISIFFIFSIAFIMTGLYFIDNNDKYWKILIIIILFSISFSIFISELIILIWISFYYNNKVKTDFTSNFMAIFVIILPLIIFSYYFNY